MPVQVVSKPGGPFVAIMCGASGQWVEKTALCLRIAKAALLTLMVFLLNL